MAETTKTREQTEREMKQAREEREADPAFKRGETVLGRTDIADVFDPTVAGQDSRKTFINPLPAADPITGRTAEEGPLQPGPQIDALLENGGIDEEGHAKRQKEISHPAVLQQEEEERRQKAAEKRPRDTGNVRPAASAEDAGDDREVEVGKGTKREPGVGRR